MTVILLLILLLAACAGFILTGAMRFAVFGIFLIIALLLRIAKAQKPPEEAPKNPLKQNISPLIPVGAVLAVFLFLPAPLKLHTTMRWRYPFQKALIQVYNKMPKWFPDFGDDVKSDFVFDYMPTIMQGTGHESVCFVTTPERAAEIQTQYAAVSKYALPLPETVFSSNFCELTVPEEKCAPFADSEWDGTASFYCDREFWFPDGTVRPDASVYILDARGDWNHWGCSAVIVSVETGAVQYSQFGFTYLAYGG